MPSPVAVVIAAVPLAWPRNVRFGPSWPTGLGRCGPEPDQSTMQEVMRVPEVRSGGCTFSAAQVENRAPAGPAGEGRQLWRPGVGGPTSE